LGLALNRKAQLEAPGAAEGKTMAAGDGWRVVDIVCTSGPRDHAFEEQHTWASISLVRSGTFVYRSHHGRSLMAPGAMLLGSPGNAFECSHQHGEGDRCLSFQYDPGLFARLAHDAGASHLAFAGGCLPPLRALAPLTARAATAMERQDSFEEISLELASAVIQTVGDARRNATVAARGSRPNRAGAASIGVSRSGASDVGRDGADRRSQPLSLPAHVQSRDWHHTPSMAATRPPA
jgi:AraC family transcriptional regulator